MRLTEEPCALRFEADDGRLAGRYVFRDAFKPYLHPLLTPRGLGLSCFMPHDHKHHRALMYALRTPDINFWEERPTLPGEVVGQQLHCGLEELVWEGKKVGFTQHIRWQAADGTLPTFIELRRIACNVSDDGTAFSWRWSTEIAALRDASLVMSQWSAPRASGGLVNYHGLGLRLPREFGGATADIAVLLDGKLTEIVDALGETPQAVEFRGALDGSWPVRRAGIRVVQAQKNALFIMKDPFAYLSLGPSNVDPLDLAKGMVIAESYAFDVFDVAETQS